MKSCRFSRLAVLILACLQGWSGRAQVPNKTHYTLLFPSYLADDCLLCGRPTIHEPLRGTFDLVLVQDTPPYTRYAMQNIQSTSSPGLALEKHVTGDGAYQQLEEFALTQDMTLALQVISSVTNEPAYFTNATSTVDVPFPLIQATLTQTNGNFAHTLTIHLLAAPVQEIWFSTSQPVISTNRQAPTNVISSGDLVSSTGRVIRRNGDLLARLGVMPPVPDLGLDAIEVTAGGEMLFSLVTDVFSETLGPIQHGDLVSDRGRIVKRNQELLAAFHPNSTNDAGLDAVQLMPDGSILFSVQSNVFVSDKLTLSGGDILSDQGKVYLTHQQLFSNFQPAITNQDFGLTALRVLPSGEIWFSVEQGFTDNRLGSIEPGDLLSSLGYKVFSNQDLVAALAPADASTNYGLDALFVVTDTLPAQSPPRIVRQTVSGTQLHFEWAGPGSAFQVQSASDPAGPWLPASPILPDLTWNTMVNPSVGKPLFYRLRQW